MDSRDASEEGGSSGGTRLVVEGPRSDLTLGPGFTGDCIVADYKTEET